MGADEDLNYMAIEKLNESTGRPSFEVTYGTDDPAYAGIHKLIIDARLELYPNVLNFNA